MSDVPRNSADQETDTRHGQLFSELMAQIYRHSDPFGNAWVEVVHGQEIRLHTRYQYEGETYEITHTMLLCTVVGPLSENRR